MIPRTKERFVSADRVTSEVRRIIASDEAIAQGIARAIVQIVERRAKELERQIDALKTATQNFKFVGNFEEGKAYSAGNFVGLGGSIYHANADTTSRPPGPDWTLVVPRARDGKDGKDFQPPERSVRTATRQDTVNTVRSNR